MNAESLGLFAGVVLSLAFSYIPGLNTWFQGLARENKQVLMGALLVAVAVSIFALQCGGISDFGVICSKAGAVDFFRVLVSALVANQGIYSLTKS